MTKESTSIRPSGDYVESVQVGDVFIALADAVSVGIGRDVQVTNSGCYAAWYDGSGQRNENSAVPQSTVPEKFSRPEPIIHNKPFIRKEPEMAKTPDIDKLKAEWAEMAKKIEEITGEKPKAQEPQKPVCANCKWKDNNGMPNSPYYWECTHNEVGLLQKRYNPIDGKTTYTYRDCKHVNKGDCKGFEPIVRRTWGEWLAGILFPDTHHI